MLASIRSASSAQATLAGVLAGFVGFASSFAVILQGVRAAGASPAQAASGLLAVLVICGAVGIGVSLATRMPILIAWSTPGAALLISTPPAQGGFAYAVGAFLVCGAFIVLAALWPAMSRLVAAIPRSLASAMLAGIVFELCLAPVLGLRERPLAIIAILMVWAGMGRMRRGFAVPAAVVCAVVLAGFDLPRDAALSLGVGPVWMTPRFSLATIMSLAVPLFVVTMAGQNIPGFAVLNIHGYRPRHAPLLALTGLASMLAAPFGGIPLNLAAITAAMCAGAEAHPDPQRRWWAAAAASATYLVIGLFSGLVTSFIALSSPVLITAVAGIALFGALANSLAGAAAEPAERDAAMVTFLLAASGLHLWGIGGAFWGLLGGGAVLAIQRCKI